MTVGAASAPIVFGFDAMVTEVEGDAAALNLPFSLFVGQQIHGKYSFDSEQQLLDIISRPHIAGVGFLHLLIDGRELVAMTNLGTINDGGPIDISDPRPLPASSLSLGYTSPSDVIPGWGGRNGLNDSWGAGLVLVGPEGTISVAEDVLNVASWNELTTVRRLGLSIGYPNTVLVQAAVDEFYVVPERSSAWIACVLAVALLACRRTRSLMDRG